MKSFLIVFLFALNAFAGRVAVHVSTVHIPSGFDAGADVFIIASGVFPNGCYSWAGAEVEHEGDFKHQVTAYANVQETLACPKILLPFSEEVRIGKLRPGKHTIKFINGDGTHSIWETKIIE